MEILHKRGPESRIPRGNPSEIIYTTDTQKLFYGTEIENVELAKKTDVEKTATVLIDHLSSKSNPHEVTKEQVGLGEVENYGIASSEDVLNEVSNKYMTPLTTSIAINSKKDEIVEEVRQGINIAVAEESKNYADVKINDLRNEIMKIIIGSSWTNREIEEMETLPMGGSSIIDIKNYIDDLVMELKSEVVEVIAGDDYIRQ